MFEQLSKLLKLYGIQISLLYVVCLYVARMVPMIIRGKMIAHYFWFKILSLDEDIQHCCHCFQL
jgi:hypothetical protein